MSRIKKSVDEVAAKEAEEAAKAKAEAEAEEAAKAKAEAEAEEAAKAKAEAEAAAAKEEESVYTLKAKKGEIIVQCTVNDLYHPFAGIWLHTSYPSVVIHDGWTKSQIEVGLLKVIK